MKNNIYHVSFNKKENNVSSVNDDNYHNDNLPNGDKNYLSRIYVTIRYVLAIILYVVVVVPLSIFSALKWLILLIGGVVATGLSIFYFMDSGVSGYVVCLCWIALGITGNADILLNHWIGSRYPFKLFKVAKG
ncbi:hypothetical protein ABLA30_22455 [Xenorhabdus nematophila]|uniref:hypothetical protein n=1 Tax=Xenorhabdus nematophila TaxID=628 RepID=UPI0032B7394E